MNEIDFDLADWYFLIDGDSIRVWSTREGAYVAAYDPLRTTRFANEQDFIATLILHYSRAIDERVEAVARERGYSSAVSCASYAASAIDLWRNEAVAFVSWRDQVWSFAFDELERVKSGARSAPTIAGLVDGLPVIAWPQPADAPAAG